MCVNADEKDKELLAGILVFYEKKVLSIGSHEDLAETFGVKELYLKEIDEENNETYGEH